MLFLFVQWIMWSTSEDPPGGVMEGEPSEATVNTKEKCEQNKNQLESLKAIMMRNQQSLKKKEEEVQVTYCSLLYYKVAEKYKFESKIICIYKLNVFFVSCLGICAKIIKDQIPSQAVTS